MRGYAIIQMSGGAPNLAGADGLPLPYQAYSLAAQVGTSWGLYVISGTAAQLTAINALDQVYGICAVSHDGAIHEAPGLDEIIPDGVRSRINSWLADRGYPAVPAGWTYRQVIVAAYGRANGAFRLAAVDCQDA